MSTSYALELQALKAELQRSLARLEIGTGGCSPPTSQRTDAPTARPLETPPSARNSGRSRPTSRWSRRRLVRELAAAAETRRQLETQLETQLQHESSSDRQRHDSREWREAIAELQQQRADIQRQMEGEMATQRQEMATQRNEMATQRENNESVSENRYSIGGVVTLEPLRSFQVPEVTSGVSVRPARETVERVELYPRYRNTDALNDVFSLQVKFAETMLKLEKSVQMRDQLLHHGAGAKHKRRRGLQRRESFESGASSDTSMYRKTRGGDSFSSSAYSFSSLDSTPRRGETIRVRYPTFRVSRATTAETLAPSSSSAIHLPGGAAPVSSITTTTASDEESPDTAEGNVVNHELTRQEENHSTPNTGSSVTNSTPTTGSDQKSNTSSKQVRFGDDAYSTPVLARKFNFDNPSMDEDDEEKTEEEEIILSFLDGSSITSVELNDASFLRAFQRFRRELKAPRHNASLQSPILARQLFPASNVEFHSLDHHDEDSQVNAPISVVTDDTTGLNVSAQPAPRAAVVDQDQTAKFPELAGLSVEGLQERRRQLCLDIQAASAQLVLNFGAMQNGTTRSQDAEHTKDSLLALRDELNAVDLRIGELQ